MVSRSSPRSFGRVFLASGFVWATGLGAGVVGCQSGGDDEIARGGDEVSAQGATRVPERRGAAESGDEEGEADELALPGGAEEPASEGAAEAPSAAEVVPASGGTPAAVAAAQTFSACYTDGGVYSDCEIMYVTVTQASPGRCIQLTIDTCGTYGRQGLSADTPSTWRLAGGSVGAAAAPCEPGAFYSSSASVVDASGSISWDETTRRPSALVFDLTLEPSSVSGDAEVIQLATPEPLVVGDCDE